MSRDAIFSNAELIARDFAFDRRTAEVFDDMIERSVPFYRELQRMTAEIAARFARPDTTLYDLGCATGRTLVELDDTIDPSVRFVGLDNSADMLAQAQNRLHAHGVSRPYELRVADLRDDIRVPDASVVVLLLTLQFVRPLQRAGLARSLASQLPPGGCLVLVEKVTSPDSTLNRAFIDFYLSLKRRHGYSNLEIAQKREALENVLIPFHAEENREMLLQAGFARCEEFFRWYNFAGFVALK